MKSTMINFLKILFNEDELIWSGNQYCSNKYSTDFNTAAKNLVKLSPTRDGIFVALNPARSVSLSLSSENVAIYRNFLIEMDTVKGIDKQLDFIKLSGIPYSSLVFSGGKSVHIIISLHSPLSDLVLYKDIHSVLCKKLAFFADKATNRPSATTKVPGLYRTNDQGLLSEQKLLELRDRITEEELLEYVADELQVIRTKRRIKEMITNPPSSISILNNSREIFEQYIYEQNHGSITSSKKFSIQCPLCHKEGGDRKKQNLSIDLSQEKVLTYCHANREHSHSALLTHLRECRNTPR